jgi:hypothetical protein
MLETLFGAILAIITTIIIESLRKPSPELRISKIAAEDNYVLKPAKKARFLYLELVNNPLPKLLRWISRSSAMQCHGTITFHHLDGQNVFGRSMDIRWTNLPNPMPVILKIENKQFQLFDSRKFNHDSKVDIYPGESELLNVASRFDDESECYGWCNENLWREPLWRNPDWKLQSGRYLVRVEVVSAGEKCVGMFRLINDVDMKDFRLEEALPSDKVIE